MSLVFVEIKATSTTISVIIATIIIIRWVNDNDDEDVVVMFLFLTSSLSLSFSNTGWKQNETYSNLQCHWDWRSGRRTVSRSCSGSCRHFPGYGYSGAIDSKRLTEESDREAMYKQIVSSKNIRWAVAVVSAEKIDQISILKATLLGMRMAATVVMNHSGWCETWRMLCGSRWTNHWWDPWIGKTRKILLQ